MLHRRSSETRRIDIGEGQPGVVDEDIEMAEASARFRAHPVAFRRLAQIGDARVEMPCPLQLFGLGPYPGHISLDMADRYHRMTFACQSESHRLAQTAQTSRHERNATFAIVRHGFLRLPKAVTFYAGSSWNQQQRSRLAGII